MNSFHFTCIPTEYGIKNTLKSEMFYAVQTLTNNLLRWQYYCYSCLRKTLRKKCRNTVFLWPVYYRIWIESAILSLYAKKGVTENPYSGVFYPMQCPLRATEDGRIKSRLSSISLVKTRILNTYQTKTDS